MFIVLFGGLDGFVVTDLKDSHPSHESSFAVVGRAHTWFLKCFVQKGTHGPGSFIKFIRDKWAGLALGFCSFHNWFLKF